MTHPFTGSFNGNGYIITGLTINRPTGISHWGVGLFGAVGSAASISNVGLVNLNFTGYGSPYSGGLVGINYGTISNVYVTGSVTGGGGLAGCNYGTILNSYTKVIVSGGSGFVGNNFAAGVISGSYAEGTINGGSYLGGLAGSNYGSISNSHFSGSVIGSGSTGGLVGENGGTGTISNSYATGTVSGDGYVGGLVGNNYGTILRSYATSAVSGNSDVGGLVGYNYLGLSYFGDVWPGIIANSYATGSVTGGVNSVDIGGLVGRNSGAVSNAYATGNVSGNTNIGGLVGYNYGGTPSIFNSFATGSVSGSSRIGGLVGYNVGSIANSGWWTGAASQAIGSGGAITYNEATKAAFMNTSHGVYTAGSSTWDISNNTGHVWIMLGNPHLQAEWAATITNVYQLQLMAFNLSAIYTLANNIDASETINWNGGQGFIPVGSTAALFTGSFNGNSKTISGLYINRPSTDDVGLFGRVSTSANINYVGLENSNITGHYSVGSLVGRNFGNVSNSYVTGAVSGIWDIGGLVGLNLGTVSNSYAAGTVSGSDNSDSVGGLVGRNYLDGVSGHSGAISNSYAIAIVSAGVGSSHIGGLLGGNDGSGTVVSNSYVTGNVSGGTGSSYIGGLMGYNSGTVANSGWWTGSSAAPIGNGGTVTYNEANKSAFMNASHGIYTVGSDPWDISNSSGHIWIMIGYPHLQMEWTTSISNVYQLQMMSLNLAAVYALANNVDASETVNWNGGQGFTPVGTWTTKFTGTFDGTNYTITGLNVNPISDEAGLFGCTGNDAVIKNVGLLNINVNGDGASTGGLVGSNDGNISNSYVTGTVHGNYHVGGLAGWSSGSISNSYSTAAVIGGLRSGGSGSFLVGGLVGVNGGTISNSYASGNVSGSDGSSGIGGLVGLSSGTGTNSSGRANVGSVTNSYATGNVTSGVGSTDIGGLEGSNLSASVTNSYFTDNTHGDQTGKGSYEAGGVSAFYAPSHSVYNVGGGDQWDIFTPLWDTYTDELPHLHFENHSGNIYSVWSGTASSAWATSSNWVSGIAPGAAAGVFISARANNPVVSSNSTFSEFFIGAGAIVDIQSNNLVVSGVFTNKGVLKLSGVTGQIIPSVSTTQGTIEYTGSGASLVGGLNYYDLKIDGGNYTVSGALRAYHNFDNSGTLNIGGNNLIVNGLFTNIGTLKLSGVTDQIIPTVSTTQGTIEYTGSGSSLVGGLNYYDLKIDGGNYAVSGALRAYHNFNNSGTIDIGENNLVVNGVFTNNGILKLSGISGQIIPAVSTTQGTIEYSSFLPSFVNGYNYFNLKIDAGTYSLSGNTNFPTINGTLTMDPAFSINGEGYNLSISAGGASILGNINNVNLLTLSSSSGSNVTFTSNASSAFEANTVKTNYHAIFSRNVGTGTSLDPKMIFSVSNMPGGLQYIPTSGLGLYYKLANNIDASETSSWSAGAGFSPIGTAASMFTGSFNGDNHTVTGLSINRTGASGSAIYLGLFGVTDAAATISNVGLTNYSITGNANASNGASYVGALVGQNGGSISNSYATGTASASGWSGAVGGLVGLNWQGTVSNSYASSSISGNYGYLWSSFSGSGNAGSAIGGLVGKNYNGNISDSYATGTVSGNTCIGGLVGNSTSGAIFNTYATGNVNGSGDGAFGGLVGRVDYGSFSGGTIISSSYATGSVTAATGSNFLGGLVGLNYGGIENSYATGAVSGTSGGSRVGGLVGVNSGLISNSYAKGTVIGSSAVSGPTGYIGGLVGQNDSMIVNSYATGTASGGASNSIGGLVGTPGYYSSVTNSYFTDNTHGSQTGRGTYESGGIAAFYTPRHLVYNIGDSSQWDIFTPIWDTYTNELPRLHLENHSGNNYFVWSGTTSNNWSTLSNWAGGTVPGVTSNIFISARANNPIADIDVTAS